MSWQTSSFRPTVTHQENRQRSKANFFVLCPIGRVAEPSRIHNSTQTLKMATRSGLRRSWVSKVFTTVFRAFGRYDGKELQTQKTESGHVAGFICVPLFLFEMRDCYRPLQHTALKLPSTEGEHPQVMSILSANCRIRSSSLTSLVIISFCC